MGTQHRPDEDDFQIVENKDGTVAVDGLDIPEGDGVSDEDEGGGFTASTTQNIPDDGGQDQASDTDEIRNIRREKRKAKKVFHAQQRAEKDMRFEQLKQENQTLVARLTSLEQKNHKDDLSRLDSELNNEMTRYEYAEDEIRKATASGNGNAMIAATRVLNDARDKVKLLSELKERAAQPQQPKTIADDPEVQRMARDWIANNPWYDPKLGDQDSEIALALDKRLIKEGYNPKTTMYWDEFNSRLQKTLPHRYSNANGNDNEVVRERPRSMNVSQEHGSITSGRSANSFMLNQERVRALKEAGMWDDPAKRNKMIKRYYDMDKKAGRQT